MSTSTLTPKLSLAEVADRLHLHPRRLSRLAKAGRIGHYRIGRSIYFDEADLARYLAQQRVEADTRTPPSELTDAEECARLGIPREGRFS